MTGSLCFKSVHSPKDVQFTHKRDTCQTFGVTGAARRGASTAGTTSRRFPVASARPAPRAAVSRPPPPAAAGVSRDRRGAASKALLPATGYPANSFISSGCVFCVIHRSDPIRSTKAIGIIHCTVVRSAAVA